MRHGGGPRERRCWCLGLSVLVLIMLFVAAIHVFLFFWLLMFVLMVFLLLLLLVRSFAAVCNSGKRCRLCSFRCCFCYYYSWCCSSWRFDLTPACYVGVRTALVYSLFCQLGFALNVWGRRLFGWRLCGVVCTSPVIDLACLQGGPQIDFCCGMCEL